MGPASGMAARARRLQRKDYGSEMIISALGRWDRGTDLKASIICEVLDPRTQQTIRTNNAVAQSSDFLQSNLLVSRILAMVSENRSVMHILNEMLAPDGSAMGTIKAAVFCKPEEQLTFFQLAKRVQAVGNILIGFAEPAADDDEEGASFGFMPPTINPPDKLTRRSWDGVNLCIISGARR